MSERSLDPLGAAASRRRARRAGPRSIHRARRRPPTGTSTASRTPAPREAAARSSCSTPGRGPRRDRRGRSSSPGSTRPDRDRGRSLVPGAGRRPSTARCCAGRSVFVAARGARTTASRALEALADGCQLVTTPAPGPYPALSLARELDPRLVADDLAARDPSRRSTIRSRTTRRGRAELLEPFRRAAVDERGRRRARATILVA